MSGADPEIQRLRELLEGSRRAVVFTGAGISTESGIPDFRSPGGIWSKTTPIYFDQFVASEDARRETWRRKIETDRDMRDAQPNRGHRAVAALADRGPVTHVITQNIDGLHQKLPKYALTKAALRAEWQLDDQRAAIARRSRNQPFRREC